MDNNVVSGVTITMPDFKLPKYNEIPGVGLFLEQVSKYVNECLAPLGEPELTGSMISNYVKKGIISNPVKKSYDRNQIAYLIYIALIKNVLSLEDINTILELQREVCDVQHAYEYFSDEFHAILSAVYDGSKLPEISAKGTPEQLYIRKLSQNVSMTAAHKIYLDMTFRMLKEIK